MAGPLADAAHPTARAGPPALERGPGADVRGGHDELVSDEAVVRLRVGDGRVEDPAHVPRGVAREEREDRPRLGHGAAANLVDDELRLARRRPHVARLGANGGGGCLDSRHLRLISVFRSPECARKIRVGRELAELVADHRLGDEDGHVRLPLWTAIVCPTISGKIVDVRDQVRTGRFVARLVHGLDSLHEALLDERPLLARSTH